MKPFYFFGENTPDRIITREEVIRTVTFNLNLLYEREPTQEEIDNMVNQVCTQLNIR